MILKPERRSLTICTGAENGSVATACGMIASADKPTEAQAVSEDLQPALWNENWARARTGGVRCRWILLWSYLIYDLWNENRKRA